jgi:hypothetical protein
VALNPLPSWRKSRKIAPGDVVPFARWQAAKGRKPRVVYRGSKPYVPRDLTNDQLHDVERLLRVTGLKRRHIAAMCDCSVRLINRYFPDPQPADLPLTPL